MKKHTFLFLLSMIFFLQSCSRNDNADGKKVSAEKNVIQTVEKETKAKDRIEKVSVESDNIKEEIPGVTSEVDEEGFPIYAEEDECAEIFAPYFSDDLPNYDFIIRNPLSLESLYIERLALVKNKIVKVQEEKYELDGGVKYYGDGTVTTTNWHYYVFNDDGRITDEYELYKENTEDGNIIRQSHVKRFCSIDRYYSYKFNYDGNKAFASFYDIIRDGDKLTLFDEEYSMKFEFTKDKIVWYDETDGWEDRYEYIYNGKKLTKIKYLDDAIFMINEYENGGLVQEKKASGDGFFRWDYEFDGEEGFEKADGKVQGRVNKKMNLVGFVEDQEFTPLETYGDGEYNLRYVKLLSEPDDILKQYFGFE